MKRTALGQHFLVNRRAAEKIVRCFLPVKGNILEIGPGKGILTGLLLELCRDNKVIAVELDGGLAEGLREQYGECEHLEILNRDILTVDLSRLFPGEEGLVNVISNVPYYISRELVNWVIRHRGRVGKGVFMVQKEFADKLASGPGSKDYNAQGVLFNGLFLLEKRFDVRPGSFAPPPKVKSTVFSFTRRVPVMDEGVDIDGFYGFLRRCFGKRRKTLINNLGPSVDARKLSRILEERGLDAAVRAERLGLEDFLAIFNAGV
jgi:16S rRNA (adenine1518-N6/adenine1519-N6)-dimethyltransferase